ncbi:DUF6320 domain-containing protein [Oscillospiraceae bacterium PP1C4]
MLFCDKCKVSIGGNRHSCPLCQSALLGSPEDKDEIFPVIPSNRQRYQLLIRTMIFASVAIVVISVTLNILLQGQRLWSLFVVAAVACMWVSLFSAIHRRHNIPKNIIWQVVILSLIAVAWDFLTHWRGWSIHYVIPAICVSAMAAVSGCALFMKLRIEEYMIYLILDGLLGLVPLVFLLMGWLQITYPSVICVAVSLLSLSALFSFAGDALKCEIKKRLHL